MLPPLNERRVELLILDEQFGGVTGVQCLECGWLGLEGDRCPADGSELVELEDLTEAMIELSVQQSAELLPSATSATRSRATAARPPCSGSKLHRVGRGNELFPLADDEFEALAREYEDVLIDVGTGDGRFVLRTARERAQSLVVGIDRVQDAMSEVARRASAKPSRGGVANALFLVASAEALRLCCRHGRAW